MSQDRRVHVRLPDGLDDYLQDLEEEGIISSKAEHMRNLVREDMQNSAKQVKA